jgi:hypothetical protein
MQKNAPFPTAGRRGLHLVAILPTFPLGAIAGFPP